MNIVSRKILLTLIGIGNLKPLTNLILYVLNSYYSNEFVLEGLVK